jgi:hypothetical protein
MCSVFRYMEGVVCSGTGKCVVCSFTCDVWCVWMPRVCSPVVQSRSRAHLPGMQRLLIVGPPLVLKPRAEGNGRERREAPQRPVRQVAPCQPTQERAASATAGIDFPAARLSHGMQHLAPGGRAGGRGGGGGGERGSGKRYEARENAPLSQPRGGGCGGWLAPCIAGCGEAPHLHQQRV